MKILHIYNSKTRGGAESLIFASVPIMNAENIKADVLCLKTPKTLPQNKDVSLINLKELSKRSLYNPLWIITLIPYLKKYDVIHAHLFPTLYWIVLAKLFSLSKTPIVYTEHSTSNKRRNNFFLRLFDRFIYKRISTIICISDLVKENLESHLKGKQLNYITINNGINLKKVFAAKPYPKRDLFSKDDFILVQASSFRYPKNQKVLIESLKLLPDTIKLLLVGDGPTKETNVNLVKNLNLSDRVLFLGYRTDIFELLKMSDVAVLSSHYEGLSLGNIEGMAAGKPFIGSKVPGIIEVVENYGLLFEEDNKDELADNVLKLFNDKSYYERIASQCLERSKEYDIHIMTNKYIEVYKIYI